MNDENLKKGKKFTSDYQPSNEAKSKGQIEAAKKRNIIETLRSRIDEWDLIDKVVAGVNEEVEEGNYKNAIKLIDIAKENEKQEINSVNKNFNFETSVDNETINNVIDKLKNF